MKRKMKISAYAAVILGSAFVYLSAMKSIDKSDDLKKAKDLDKAVAATPPMGWNSFDAWDSRITESEFRQTVDIMEEKLLPYGYNYAVIDYCWFNDRPGAVQIPKRRFGHPDIRFQADGKPIDTLVMDRFGRLLPSIERFPSAKGNYSFKNLADWVHGKGMKFGIHIMRGIPREAVYNNLPIKGTKYTARDIAEPFDTCQWNNNMFGVDPTKPGAQEYYNSIFELYAEWGVDFIKADDTMYPPYHKGEIELISNALRNCGRPMVLSLSCGEAPLSQAKHLINNAHMWRVSADFWDDWESLHHNFDLLNAWSPFIGNGSWPDGDMIPFGRISLNNRPHGNERTTKFTKNEQLTLMSLWCMARSPLMVGGDLISSSQDMFDVLTNKEILAINQNSKDNRQVFKNKDYAIWTATDPDTGDKYVAIFNLSEKAAKVTFNLELESMRGKYKFRDLWSKKDIGEYSKSFSVNLGLHEAKVYRASKLK